MLKAAADEAVHPWTKSVRGRGTQPWLLFCASFCAAHASSLHFPLVLRFSTGNSKTLRGGGAETRSALLDFHGLHYTAGRMSLVLLGTETLDDLEQYVRDVFVQVPSVPRPPSGESASSLLAAAQLASSPTGDARFGTVGEATKSAEAGEVATAPLQQKGAFRSPFAPGCLPRVLHVAPLRELREVVLLWPAPPVRPLYRTDPSDLCSHLLGHEADGSALAALQDRGWATALSSGLRMQDSSFSVLQVKVTLTVDGEREWRRVVAVVEEHCSLLRRMSDAQLRSHWTQMVALRRLDFQFVEKADPYAWAARHAQRLSDFGPSHALSAGYLYDDIDVEQARAWIGYLRSDNCIALLVCQHPPTLPAARSTGRTSSSRPAAKNLPPWQSLVPPLCGPECCDGDGGAHEGADEWYGVPFRCAPMPPPPTEHRPVGLSLPAPNQFVPTDLTLRMERTQPLTTMPPPPVQLADDATGALWHAADRRHGVPRVHIRLMLYGAQMSAPERLLASLHGGLLTQVLKRRIYDAEVAGLYADVGMGARGASVHVRGYSHHAPALLRLVLDTVMRGGYAEPGADKYFEAVRERRMRRLRSLSVESPAHQGGLLQDLMLDADETTIEEDLESVGAATLDDLAACHRRWRRALYVHALVCGNASAGEAQEIYWEVGRQLASHGVVALPKTACARLPRRKLLPSTRHELHAAVGNEAEKNSYVGLYMQAGVLSEPEQAALRVLCSMLKEPCFRELRTQQQIGYIVHASHEIDHVIHTGGAPPLRVEGLAIEVTSKTKSAVDVAARIRAFLHAFRSTTLCALDAETVAQYAVAIEARLLEPPKRLSSEADRWWTPIRLGSFDWAYRGRIVEAVRRVQARPQAVIELFDRLLTCQLTVHIHGTNHPLRLGDGAISSDLTDGRTRPSTIVVDAGWGATGIIVQHADTLPLWSHADRSDSRQQKQSHRLLWWAVAASAAGLVVIALRAKSRRA